MSATLMKLLLVTFVRIYKLFVSPIVKGLGGRCRFYPSCSEYAAVALERHRWRDALLLVGKRILRCGWWSEGGIDLVP